jgi:serine/threonine-protein kinase HipA
MSIEIYVFADWEEFAEPMLVGALRVDRVKNKEHFSFSYDPNWLKSSFAQQIDPQLHLFSGDQHSEEQNNFRVFLDSCPDRWSRLLMKRREAAIARQEGRKPDVLNEVNYLLGVHDTYRMGALRFKRDIDGEFLDNNKRLAAPPISSLRELEHAVQQVELKNNPDDPENLKWLYMLMSPALLLGAQGQNPVLSIMTRRYGLPNFQVVIMMLTLVHGNM